MFLGLKFVFVSADENKPIWMHAEEREEQSKVSLFFIFVCFYIILMQILLVWRYML